MKFSTFYLMTGIITMIIGLVLALNGYGVLGVLMPVVIILLVTGMLLWFFEYLIKHNQKRIPSYEEILKIYNKMVDNGKGKKRMKKKQGGD